MCEEGGSPTYRPVLMQPPAASLQVEGGSLRPERQVAFPEGMAEYKGLDRLRYLISVESSVLERPCEEDGRG